MKKYVLAAAFTFAMAGPASAQAFTESVQFIQESCEGTSLQSVTTTEVELSSFGTLTVTKRLQGADSEIEYRRGRTNILETGFDIVSFRDSDVIQYAPHYTESGTTADSLTPDARSASSADTQQVEWMLCRQPQAVVTALTQLRTLLEAQEEEQVEPTVFEAPPPALLPAEQDGNPFQETLRAAEYEPAAGWAPIDRAWTAGEVVTVCFYSNSTPLNSFVARVASNWNQIGANVSLDFGSVDLPRRCTPNTVSDIRVGYNRGFDNWSLLGVESLFARTSWRSESMQLGLRTLAGRNAVGTIIHEFGHALGLMHEHQKPIAGGCEAEFDWPWLYANLFPGSPQQVVDRQMRPVSFGPFILSESIDRDSVMLYPLPPQAYLRGVNSQCYTPNKNQAISGTDAAVVRALYDFEAEQDRQNSILDAIAQEFSSGRTERAEALSLFVLSKDTLSNISELDQREQSLGFNPDPGEDASSLLQSEISRIIAEARR